ncbi:MAG: universal stress protein [Candidatus Methanosuratincola sp.]|jgi:nucleotide-binding universal stress UspA family protein
MLQIKSIVWAYDGSEESREALKYAVAFAKVFGSKIWGIHVSVVPETVAYEQFSFLTDDLYNFILKSEEKHRVEFNSIGDRLSIEGVEFEGDIVQGTPSSAIIEYARERNADLITMGKRGLGLLDRLLVGSTTLTTFRNSNVPVLAVKKHVRKEETPRVENILVPIDITEEANSALKYAAELAEGFGARLHVLFVLRLDTYAYEVPPNVLESLIAVSERELKRRVDDAGVNRQKIGIDTEVIHGISPAVSIADYADKREMDLVVINTHARSGLTRFILGSVTEKVIQECRVPVIALKP